MSQVLVTESYLEDIADAIRGKNGLATTYKPGEMAAAITAISGGGCSQITQDANGYIVLPSTVGCDTVTQDENGYIVLPPSGCSGDSWEWYGTNAEHLTHYFETVALEDTDFATWTPSTTSTVIWSKAIAESMPPSGYHNVIAVKFIFNPIYQTGTTVVSGGTKFLYCGYTQSYRVVGSDISNWENGTTSGSGTTTLSATYLFYKNANGVDKILNSGSYGVYSTSLSSGYQTNNSVSVKAQANNTYFTTSMLSALDQEQSTFTISIDTYIMPDDYESKDIMQDILLDMYQHGLTQ